MVLEIALGAFLGLVIFDAVKDLSEFFSSKYRAYESRKQVERFLENLDDEPYYEYKLPTAKRKPAVKKAAGKKKPVKKRK
jgi:hypothetical protein